MGSAHHSLWFPDVAALLPWLARLRRWEQPRVVFTNGCFDVLHRGHFELLERCGELGEKLIVGVNTDVSVRRLKGLSRPINTQVDRVYALSRIRGVDAVVLFDGATACDVVREVRPAVYVKGGDYTSAAIPEAAVVEEYGGRVEIVPLVPALSTTLIVRRLLAEFPG